LPQHVLYAGVTRLLNQHACMPNLSSAPPERPFYSLQGSSHMF